MTFRPAIDLCPNFQKPHLPSKIPGYAPEDFIVLVDEKSFFDVPVKNKEEAYKNIIELRKNSDYTTGNLLDY